jgi:hypothetical protein
MDNLAYKFTDEDVRRESRLTYAAYEFVRAYTGDYTFLRDAKVLLNRANFLHTGTVRGILNCMRTQAYGLELLSFWNPERVPAQVLQLVDTGEVFERPRPGLRFPFERDYTDDRFDTRPARMHMRATFKAEYIMSIHKQAYITHLLDLIRSEVVWWTRTRKFEVRPIAICGARLSYGVMCLHDGGRPHCQGCIRLEGERS